MNVNLQYVASSGNVYNLKSDGIRTKTANYHKWNWGVNATTLQFGSRISDFTRKPAQYETMLILDGSYTQRKTILESLHDDFELDVRNKNPGRVIWGDYYLDCYVIQSSTEPDENNVWTDNIVEFYAPYPFWIKEETRQFTPKDVPASETFLDYPYDYEYDYSFGNPGVAVWQTDFPFASEFLLKIYGPAANPRILINSYSYQVFDTLEGNEYITIDSRNNKVTKYLPNGSMINAFDLRNKNESVFQAIPGGTLRFNWSGTFNFDLTLYEERSEPRKGD